MLAKVLVALILLAEIAGAALAFQFGVWPVGVLLIVGVVGTGVVAARVWTGAEEYRTGEYVESDRHYY